MPDFQIEFLYDKPSAHPLRYDAHGQLIGQQGYDVRPAVPLTDLLWHSTNHQPGQTYEGVCAYLRDSLQVSANYCVDEDGTIQRLVDPGPWRAWHAGESLYPPPPAVGRRSWNDFSVGIELFHTGAGPYPDAQIAAAAWLAGVLIADHPTIRGSAAHRWVAIRDYADNPPQYGRKTDPDGLSDDWLHAWFATFSPSPDTSTRPAVAPHTLDFCLRAPPSISAATIDWVLAAARSPAEGLGATIYDICVKVGIDPAYALAWFIHETSAGTQGPGAVNHNPGNLRHAPGIPEVGGFAVFSTWVAGFANWAAHMQTRYLAQGLTTVAQIVPVYAPASDHNSPLAYISAVQTLVQAWQTLSPAPPVAGGAGKAVAL